MKRIMKSAPKTFKNSLSVENEMTLNEMLFSVFCSSGDNFIPSNLSTKSTHIKYVFNLHIRVLLRIRLIL